MNNARSGQDAPPSPPAYVGRFAPSPTGPLHFGSLVAALGSFLQARTRANGRWLVRMEDLDPPREEHGAADAILRALDGYGLHWDDAVLYQSHRADAYQAALEQLVELGMAYPCACSRADVAAASVPGAPPGHYPGTCRAGLKGRIPRSTRVRCEGTVSFSDRLHGSIEQDLRTQVGDFVIRRADGLFAYQLAVVVDDAAQGVTEIVRGSDLLDSTGRQLHLQSLLDLRRPAYVHLPLATDAQGRKLSKQTGAAPLDPDQPVPALWRALNFLGQRPAAELQRASRTTLLQWALQHWDISAVPAVAAASSGP